MKYVIVIAALACSLSSCAQTSTKTMDLHEPQNTLTKLEAGESITIQYHSVGCFSGAQKKLMIIKQGNGYQAELYNIRETYDAKAKKIVRHPDSLVNTAILTGQNIDDFARFEHELTYERENNCTTVDKYVVKSKYLNIEKTDGSCRWNGFYNLTRSFFGVGN